jgi:hypothetical protein
MLGITLNKEVVDRCVKALKSLKDIQAGSRKRLVQDTQDVCSNCEAAYSALLARLQPVKEAYRTRLAQELRALSADSATRAKFKPEGLCSQIDHLLADFQNNLNGVKYSVHLFSITEIRETLQSMGNYDQALYHQYDAFMRDIGRIAASLDAAPKEERRALVAAAKDAVGNLENDLTESITSMRAAKRRIVKRM